MKGAAEPLVGLPLPLRTFLALLELLRASTSCCSCSTLSVRGITVVCYFRKNYLMPLIICKNNKHLVTLYNVIFSDMTGILSYLSCIFF